jgi:hypothetical protein
MSTREERILFWLQPLPWKATPEENSLFSDTMNQLHPFGEKLFLSARPRFIKSLEEPGCLESVCHAQRLIDLLMLMRTVEVLPDVGLLPAVEKLHPEPSDRIPLLLSRPIPNWRTWVPLLGWFLAQPDVWSMEVRLEAARLMELWQQHSPDRAIYRQEIGRLAFQWLEETERTKDDDEL